ncbi:hypothetical protein GQ53DRAFT_630361, partial [Thozetella sp. PMI_491]
IRALRYGATIAFFAKASLAGSAVIAFRQQVWSTVRACPMTVEALDSLFSAVDDPLSLLNKELLKKAWIAVLLAFYVWMTPLVVIFTSETLAVAPFWQVLETTCPSVRTLNFTKEAINDWRDPPIIDGLYEFSVCYWNNTTPNTSDPNFFDYFDSTSQPFIEVSSIAAYLKRPLAHDNAALEICGSGWNCSYTITFVAPGYKCSELARGVASETKSLGGQEPPFNTSMFAPDGDLVYYADAYRGEYANPQIASHDGGQPDQAAPFPEHLGAIRTEPILWMGLSVVNDTTKAQPANRSVEGWDTAYTPVIFACEHYETEYVVQFNYTGGVQETSVRSRNFLGPVVNTTFQEGIAANDGTLDNTTATPESRYVTPRPDIPTYRLTAAYHSMGSLLRAILNGTIDYKHITHTKATQTKLIDRHTWLPTVNLMDDVQSLYEDMILSMFAEPQFLAVTWAATPDQLAGANVSEPDDAHRNEALRYPCTKSRTEIVFSYHVGILWAVYSSSLALAVLAAVLGLLAIRRNEGRTRHTKFSNIVAATRAPGLEAVIRGEFSSPQEGDGARRARKLKLGYGQLINSPANDDGV